MNKKHIRIFGALMSLLIILNSTQIKAASDWPEGPEVESEAAILLDYDTGTILYEKNAKDKHYPASITKIMTAMVALENSELDEIVTFSTAAALGIEPGSSSISRDVGEQMSMEDCVYGLLLESANECGNAIAEHVGNGDADVFVSMMNKRASELGCVNTHFANPHGLHEEDHYTCAYDMGLIARAAYANPTFAMITGTKSYTIPPTNMHSEPTLLNNHHGMLNYYRTNKYIYENCVGGKTGYTSDAGATLVTYAKKDGITLVCVTMRASSAGHYSDTRLLFDYYFEKLKKIPISDLGERVSRMAGNSLSKLTGGEEIPYEINTSATILLPNEADVKDVVIEYIADGTDRESAIGYIGFTYKDRFVGRANIYGREINVYPFKNMAEKKEQGTEKLIVINVYKILGIIVATVAVILLLAFIVLNTNRTIAVARRKKIENRDPHKNMRRIKRARRRRAGRF